MSEPLRNLADIYYGKSPASVLVEESDIPIFGTGGEYGRASRALFNGPAIVVPRKGSLGNPHFVSVPFWAADTTYAVVPKPTIDARWLYYSLDAYDLTKLNEATGVPSINRDWLYRILFYRPLCSEQRHIAEILRTLDETIEQTEALIAKYQQIKAGLMHDLFTRGVTLDGRLRPPRDEAPQLYKQCPFGWIPKEWTLGRLIDYLDSNVGIKPGPFGSSITKDTYTPSGFRVYGQEQVIAGRLDIGNYYISPQKFSELRGFEVLAGDVLISLVGTVGCVLVVEPPFEPGLINPRLMRLRPATGVVIPRYLKHLLLSSVIQRQLNVLAGGGTMPVINGKVIRRLYAPSIGVDEQRFIVDRLDSIDEYIDSLGRSRQAHAQKARAYARPLNRPRARGGPRGRRGVVTPACLPYAQNGY